MIGTSLTLCVSDILAGKMPEANVDKIVAMTRLSDEAAWDAALKRYCDSYWRQWDRALALALVKRLRAAGKIEQPRLTDSNYGHYVGSRWCKTEKEIQLDKAA